LGPAARAIGATQGWPERADSSLFAGAGERRAGAPRGPGGSRLSGARVRIGCRFRTGAGPSVGLTSDADGA
jgi:hypothetical protein